MSELEKGLWVIRVEAGGAERLSIDLRQFETTRLVLRTISTGAIREVWLGSDGRIIKATIPALGLTALRD